MRTTINFSADTETDRDLLDWLSQQENRSEAIRHALRAHIAGEVTNRTIYTLLKAMERKLSEVSTQNCQTTAHQPQPKEPPKAAQALDALANL